MTSTILSIDFGTTFTTAALWRDGRAQLLDLDDGPRMPSSVLLTDGGLVAGRLADNQAVLDPASYEPTPKRRVGHGTVVLGATELADSDLVAAVLSEVTAHAARHLGGRLPDEAVHLTHPAAWGRTRCDVLLDAAAAAGIDRVHLVPEPVAAAAHYTHRTSTTSQAITLAVYDLGGGTFDTAVVTRRDDGYALLGPPGGIDPLGGVDFDHRLIDHLGRTRFADTAQWQRLTDPPDRTWRRHRQSFLISVRQCKEALSRFTTHAMYVPGIDTDVLVTRDEFEGLIADDVESTVAQMMSTIAGAGLAPEQLTAIYLVGGSSRIPLVAQTVWRQTGVQPSSLEDPKAVVALGATLWQPATAPVVTSSRRSPKPLPAPVPPLPPPELGAPTLIAPEVPGGGNARSRSRWLIGLGAVAAACVAVAAALTLNGGGGGNAGSDEPTTSASVDDTAIAPPTVDTTATTATTAPPTTTPPTTTPPTTGPPTTTPTTTTTELSTMFPSVDFTTCEEFPPRLDGAEALETERCRFAVDEQGTTVVVEFFNWNTGEELEQEVAYWAGTPNAGTTESWSDATGTVAGRVFRVELIDPERPAIFWTYDAQYYSALVYPDVATGATIEDVDAWWLEFTGRT